jgi:Lon protease-like protein
MSSPIADEILEAAPVFPLPTNVLLPGTLLSLHIFEPRYRAMMEYVIEGHRHLVVALIDEKGEPDDFGRPPLHKTAGVGSLQRCIRLPDGRYNLVLEGLARVSIKEELPPDLVFRRARASLLPDRTAVAADTLRPLAASVKALCSQALVQPDPDVLAGLAGVREPGRLADLVAAAAFQDSLVRQQVMEETSIEARLDLVAGALGELVLQSHDRGATPRLGWGTSLGQG